MVIRGNGARRSSRLSLVVVALICVSTSACGDDTPTGPPPPVDLAVLFVGNSLTYSNDLPGMVENLLVEYSDVGSVYVESVAIPNFGLEDHWTEGTARARIAEGGWDVVIIQQGPSAIEGRPSLIEYSARFAEEVRAVGGDLALYMVWPSVFRAQDFREVSESHQMAADSAGALLFPVAEAWETIIESTFPFDLYGADGVHPSIVGTFLASLVMFEQLSGVAPSELPGAVITPDDIVPLSDELSAALHEAAEQANAEFAVTLPR